MPGITRRNREVIARSTGAALLCLIALPGFAQYQLHELADMETGKVPPETVTIGPTPAETIQVVDLSQVEDPSPAFRSGKAARETGSYALRLKVFPVPGDFKTNSTGIAVGTILDRDKLGATGRALYQADFFLPGDTALPNLAVLAMEPPDDSGQIKHVETVRKPFYRFGITKNAYVYFSSFHPNDQKANIFADDRTILPEIPRPGWHRFAIVMEGPETIRCYIDGRETSFSPLTDTKLRKLMVGVMLADPNFTYDAYVDNLSIQVSQDAALLPESPYQEGWKVAAGSAQDRAAGVQRVATETPAPASLGSGWVDASMAWAQAQAQRKPLLMYFYAPGVSGAAKMDALFAGTPAAQSFLQQHSATRIDVNQLQGGKIAKQYQVFKVPTLITVAPDGRSFKRYVPSSADTWEHVEAQLRLN